MPHELTDLKPAEISVVPRPAVRRRFLVLKSGGSGADADAILETLRALTPEQLGQVLDLLDELGGGDAQDEEDGEEAGEPTDQALVHKIMKRVN